MDASVVERKEAWVSGHNGTSLGENFALQCVGPLSVALTSVGLPWLFPGRVWRSGRWWETGLKLGLDWATSVLPTLLSLTLMADSLGALLGLLALLGGSMALFSVLEYVCLVGEGPRLREALRTPVYLQRPLWLSHARTNVLLSSSLAIFAVDTSLFPRRFAKTETFGFGLMDIGVGLFTYVNGLSAPEAKKRVPGLSARLRACLPLLGLGLVRLAAIKASGYQEHRSEYGLHWNFFFSLALVKLLSSMLGSLVPLRRFGVVLGLLVVAGYEALLSKTELRRVLLAPVPAEWSGVWGLVTVNLGGLCSSLGLLGIHLAAVQTGAFALRERVRLKEWGGVVWPLLGASAVGFLACVGLERGWERPSRRLGNAAYVAWVLGQGCWSVAAYVALEWLVQLAGAVRLPLYASAGPSPFHQLEPNLWRAISDAAMPVFLGANVLTGLANAGLGDLAGLGTAEAFALLSLYALALLPIAWLFQRRTA